jgi:hypothetical protein
MENFFEKVYLIALVLVSGSFILDSHAWGEEQTLALRVEGRITSKDAEGLEEMEQLISRKPELEEKREQHIFWLIEHHPESELAGSPEAGIMPIGLSGSTDGYQRGKQLWAQQAEKYPDNQQNLLAILAIGPCFSPRELRPANGTSKLVSMASLRELLVLSSLAPLLLIHRRLPNR